jgi:sec-independent protein translocase protein TatC
VAAASAHAPQLPPDDDWSFGSGLSLLDHLEELRKRILRACLAVAVGAVVAFAFIERIVNFVLAPMRRALPAGSVLMYTNPGEAFSLYIEIAMIAGVVFAAPVIMYQVWRFIAPALYSKEKWFVVPFVGLSSSGLIGGALFSHYIVFRYLIVFFGTFSGPDLQFMPRLEDAFSLYTTMLLGMVVVFQMPTLVFFLARMRLVTARFLFHHIKYAILLTFIISAVATPSSDPWNQTIFALPMMVLYLLSIGIAWVARPRSTSESGEV